MAHVEDLWTKAGPNGRRVKSERHGRGKRWLAVWTVSGRRHKKAFDGKQAATDFLAKQNVEQTEGLLRPGLTVQQWSAEYLAAQIQQRPKSRKTASIIWTNHINPQLGDKKLRDLTRADVQAAVIVWNQTLAASTTERVYRALASGLKAAVADHLMRESPCTRAVKLPAQVRVPLVILTPAQVHVIASEIHARYRVLVELGAATGMRSGELRGLTVGQITWTAEGAVIDVDRQLIGMGPTWGPLKTPASYRQLGIDLETARRLRKHVARYPSTNGLVFTTGTGNCISPPVAQSAWKTATAGLKLRPRNGWHDLRHFQASLLIAAGLSAVDVAARLGHDDIQETLNVYSHLWPTHDGSVRSAVTAGLWTSQPTQSPVLSVLPGGVG